MRNNLQYEQHAVFHWRVADWQAWQCWNQNNASLTIPTGLLRMELSQHYVQQVGARILYGALQ